MDKWGMKQKKIQGPRNIVQNTFTPKVLTVGVYTQTQDHEYMQTTKYTNTPTSDMYRDNTSTQTQPMQYSEAGTNTNMGSNIFAQTQPMQFSEAETNTNVESTRF